MPKTYGDSNVTYGDAGFNYIGGINHSDTHTDSVVVSESLSKGIGKLFSEVITILDDDIKNFIRTFSEIFNVGESLIRGLGRNHTDTLTITDPVSKGLAREYTDEAETTDSHLRGIGRHVTDTITLTEVFSKTANFLRTFTETIALDEKLKRFNNGIEWIWDSIVRTVSTSWTDRTKPETDWTKRDKPWLDD